MNGVIDWMSFQKLFSISNKVRQFTGDWILHYHSLILTTLGIICFLLSLQFIIIELWLNYITIDTLSYVSLLISFFEIVRIIRISLLSRGNFLKWFRIREPMLLCISVQCEIRFPDSAGWEYCEIGDVTLELEESDSCQYIIDVTRAIRFWIWRNRLIKHIIFIIWLLLNAKSRNFHFFLFCRSAI